MRRPFQVALIFLAVAACGVSAWFALHSPGPDFRGESVNFWVRSLANPKYGEAETVLEGIGVPALPNLVAAFENRDRVTVRVWINLWNRLPPFARGILPAPFPWRAIHGTVAETIGFIGSQYRSGDGAEGGPIPPKLERAVQALADGLGSTDARERISCAQALSFIGPAARDATPALLGMFAGGDSKERIRVCQALGTIGSCSKASDSVIVLTDALDPTDPKLTTSAADALGGIGSQAQPAVPALVKLLVNSDERVRQSAVRALARIGNIPNDVRPRLESMTGETSGLIRAGAAVSLLRIDPEDKLAIRVIKDCLRQNYPPNVSISTLSISTLFLMRESNSVPRIAPPDFNVAPFARKALRQITESATNVGAALK
jgi:hypothetical protein